MKYLDYVLGTRIEKYEISTDLSRREIKNTVGNLERMPLLIVRNRLTGIVEGNVFKLKLGLINVYPFLPTVFGDISQFDQNNKVKIELSYHGLGLSFLRFWFFITHAIVLLLGTVFFINFIRGKSQLPLTVNGESGYFFNNIWLLLISISIAIMFICLPILVGKYCWNKTKSETSSLFEGD